MIKIDSKIDAIFDKYMSKDYFTGGVSLIKQNDENVFLKSYGFRNTVTKEKVTSNTIFDLASVTKIITSTLILKLITDQKLDLATTLNNCLPQTADNSELAPITIKQLLTHSSGLIAWYPFYAHHPNEELFTILNSINLKHNEDKLVVYSDLNYILLGEVIKEKYNTSLKKVLNTELVHPMQLKNLTYGPIEGSNMAATEFGNRIEMGMVKSRDKSFSSWRNPESPIIGEVNDGNAHYFFKGQSGHAGLFGTAKDLEKILDLYLKGGMVKEKSLIDSALVSQSLKNVVCNRGLGWHSSDPFPSGFGHTGFTGTSIWLVPEHNLQVILLTNRLHVEEPLNINPFRKELHQEILRCIS